MLSLGLSLWGANAVAVTPLLPGEFRPPRFTDADAFGALAIGAVAPQALSMPGVSDGDSFGALTLAATTPQALTFSAFADADTFDGLIVGAESLDIFLSEFVDDDTFHAFSVGVASGQALTFGAFADADSFGASTIAKATPQSLTMPAFTDADTFGASEVWYGLLLEFDGVTQIETSDIGDRTFSLTDYLGSLGTVSDVQPTEAPIQWGDATITPDDVDLADGTFVRVTAVPKFVGVADVTIVNETWALVDEDEVEQGVTGDWLLDLSSHGGQGLLYLWRVQDGNGSVVVFRTDALLLPTITELPVEVTTGDAQATFLYEGREITEADIDFTVSVTAGDGQATFGA